MTKKKTTKKIEEEIKEDIQQETINILQKITQSNLFRFFMIGLITLILFFSFYSYIQHKIYQNSLSQFLPEETTYAFLEVKNSEFLDQTQRLKTHPNQEQITQFLNLEESQLNKTKITPILKQATQKNISIQIYQNRRHPLFIYQIPENKLSSIKFPLEVIQQNSDTKWYYSIQKDILTISDNRDVTSFPFQDNYKLINSESFQDAFQNIPKHNIAWFAVNHSLSDVASQDSLFPNNPQSYLLPFTQLLGYSVGYLNINAQGLLVGIYSNPKSDTDINLSPLRNLDKFNPSLHKYLPPLQEIDALISATDSYSILDLLLQNNPKNQLQLQNLAVKNNLTLEDIETIKQVFSNEYLIYKQQDSYTLLLPELDNQQRQDILNLISNIEALHNPVVKSHILEDGSTARTRSAAESINRKLENQAEPFTYRLTNLNQNIQVDFTHKDHSTITYSPSSTKLQPVTNLLEKNQKKPERFVNLLPQASSHLYLSESQTLDLIKSQEINLYPANVNSSSYFFNDGIQLLFQLTW